MKTFTNCKRMRNSKLKRHLKKKKRHQKNKAKYILRSRWKLRTKIQKMPLDIQKKICIWTWRLYWRDFVPITAKVPTWMVHSQYMQRQLWEARLKNIHFLHLPMNIIPENKEWIMGCQCDFCISTPVPSQYGKAARVIDHIDNINYFSDTVPQESIGYWNSHYYLVGNPIDGTSHMTKIFDPLCGSIYEDRAVAHLRNGTPIDFNL
mgnify:FL=1